MGKHLSNYWKKQAPHKRNDFIIGPKILWNRNNDLPIIEKTYIYEGQITPTRVIKNKNAYEIISIHPQYIIYGFTVTTFNDIVETIALHGFHPNRDPDTNLYCLPDYKKGVQYSSVYYELILTNIKTYYLDSCFFMPAKAHLEYKKMNSMSMQMNKGD